ncbi:hypothetical protein [Agromyces aureus]|uniref:Uncharacterized protein n=1 Tax=Agromyces aureus TaxID=453304 RepID=A0A191WB87_9MICO|nr:hypothetical protein [Agromyces aureus]ANJ25520.1 hypothetical protein ATC03_00775 [Agromyces aureus]
MTAANPGEVLDTDLEADETVVVDRRASVGTPPVAPAELDETIVVSRGPAPIPPPPVGPAPSDVSSNPELDETIVVDRTTAPTVPAAVVPVGIDETIVVDRTATGTGPATTAPATTGPAATDLAGIGPAAPDDTIVVERTVVRATPLPTDGPDAIMHAPMRRSRRVTPAPVSDDVLRTAEVGTGPGLLEHYAARPLEPTAPRLAAPAYTGGVEPTRDPAQPLPSVARSSRRSAIVVLAAFAGSCVVAVGGLAAVAVLAFVG